MLVVQQQTILRQTVLLGALHVPQKSLPMIWNSSTVQSNSTRANIEANVRFLLLQCFQSSTESISDKSYTPGTYLWRQTPLNLL